MLGDRIKEVRERRSMTQVDLAKKTGFHSTVISHYESNRRCPAADKLIAICKALNISSDYLLGLTKEID